MTLFEARWGFGLAPTNAITGLDDKICRMRTSEYSTGRQCAPLCGISDFRIETGMGCFHDFTQIVIREGNRLIFRALVADTARECIR